MGLCDQIPSRLTPGTNRSICEGFLSGEVGTLAIEHNPDEASEWPMLDFTEPIRSGVSRFLQKNSPMASISSGSPTLVPGRNCVVYLVLFLVSSTCSVSF